MARGNQREAIWGDGEGRHAFQAMPSANLPFRLLALHGFWGKGADFALLREACGESAPTLHWHCPDLPGHGAAPPPPCFPTMMEQAESLAQDITAHFDRTGEPTILLGYSMGGRLALLCALRPRPVGLAGLGLISTSPGVADPAAARQRVAEDENFAVRLEDSSIPLADLLREFWSRPVFHSPQWPPPMDSAWFQQRLKVERHGLAAALRAWSVGRQPDLWPELPHLTLPVLLVHGGLDGKFAAIHRRMAGAMPRSDIVELPDCGHVVHAEKPRSLAGTLLAWMKLRFPLFPLPS